MKSEFENEITEKKVKDAKVQKPHLNINDSESLRKTSYFAKLAEQTNPERKSSLSQISKRHKSSCS